MENVTEAKKKRKTPPSPIHAPQKEVEIMLDNFHRDLGVEVRKALDASFVANQELINARYSELQREYQREAIRGAGVATVAAAMGYLVGHQAAKKLDMDPNASGLLFGASAGTLANLAYAYLRTRR